MNRYIATGVPVACLAVLMYCWRAEAQSLDDVHVLPREARAGLDTMSIPSPPGGNEGTFKVDVNLVLVPVSVTDALNRPVTTLQERNFKVYEGDKPQRIRYFFEEDAPLSIAVLLDISASMRNKIEMERSALRDFFNNANPEDEYFAITFSDRPNLIASGTSSIDEMERQLISAEPGGPTAMLDAIYLAEAQLRSAKYKRRAIVIFSDGGDNISHHSHREIRGLVRERDVEVYAIGLFEKFLLGAVGTLEEKLGKVWLSQITDCTGGRTIAVQKQEKVPEAAAAVSREIRSQYVIGYLPAMRKDGKWRKIKVRVASSSPNQPLHAAYKQGYISSQK